jgi:pyrroloquinoline quinone (PQQ) biosynthesis protein C
VPSSEIIEASPSSAVQAMVGTNYYMAERRHPCSVLGMLYVLEIISSVYGGQVASSIASGLDRPLSSGFSFLESHASMDMDHMSKLRNLLQSVDLPEAQNALIESVKTNFYLFMQILKD